MPTESKQNCNGYPCLKFGLSPGKKLGDVEWKLPPTLKLFSKLKPNYNKGFRSQFQIVKSLKISFGHLIRT